ncbi:MAG TPA: polysaccharide lyase family 8 super-sandwich domain-containing protein, partial [Thermoanaerobaculia bacterium]|nr:polysaccharide lyase family 8 super-sandwich domain-containing protein [Thermoanaerobaculia bacterium]
DAALRTKIEVAIAYIPTFYGPTIKAQGNWWFWTIGPALDLGPALVLAEAELSPAVRDAAVATLRARAGLYPGLTSSGSVLDGQNVVWSSMNHLMLAILERDDARAAAARDRMIGSVRVTEGEGIRSDLSFQQHGPQLYTGGYGSSFAYDVSRYRLFTAQTPFALSAASEALFADFLVDGIARSLYDNYFDPSVIGREVTKPWTSGWNGLAALLHGAGAASPRREEIAAAAARMMRTWPGGLAPELASLAASVESAAPRWPDGTRIYWDSDLAISRRAEWYASIRMHSTRTRSGENTNEESLLGSRQSDGRLYLAVDGDEFWQGAWPAMDWARLPGITVERRPNAASAYYGMGRRSFVGGATDGDRGVAAMELAPFDSTLEARKSWIFFDDSIVFLASGIRATSSYPVETIVEQRPLRGVHPLFVDGAAAASAAGGRAVRWAAAEKIGYFFPEGQDVRFEASARTGSWSDLGSAASGSSTQSLLTILIDHGIAPVDASAAYVIVPATAPDAMARWAAAPPVEILANDATVAAARDRRDGSVGATFWRAGSVAGMAVDRPVVVFRSGDTRASALSVADPARKSTVVRVILDGAWRVTASDRRVTSSRVRGKTLLDVELSGGRTTNVALESAARRRAVWR